MNLKTILVLSIVANVILAVSLTQKKAPTPPTPPASAPAPKTTPPEPSVTPEPISTPAPESMSQTDKTFGWENVESPDYKEYIANLRSIGCPEETIKDIIVADVSKLYKEKKREARGEPKEFEFWKPGMPFLAAANSKDMEESRKLDKERNEVLRALGIEPDTASLAMSSMMNPMETMMNFLPEDKKAKVIETMMDHQAKMAKASKGGQPDTRVIADVQKSMEAEIAKLLDADENLNYQLRFSMTANQLRMGVGGFDPSKEEFMTLFNLRKEFDEQHSILNRSSETPAEQKQRQAAEKILKETLKEALGEGRYADYEMAQDWKFKQAHMAATRTGLGTDEAKAVWEMRKAAEDQAKELRRNREMEKAQRDAALAGIRAETEASIRDIFGDKGWENYTRGNGTTWLNGISKLPEDLTAPAPTPIPPGQ